MTGWIGMCPGGNERFRYTILDGLAFVGLSLFFSYGL